MLNWQKASRIKSLFFRYSDVSRALKIINIIVYTFILLALSILIKTSPEGGYELSIYRAYPILFWFFLFGSIIMSICIIIFSSIFNSKYWIFGVLALFICYTVILFLPSIRGYLFFATGSGDIFSHLAHIQKLLDFGYLREDLFYPITHILTVNFNLITHLPVRSTTYLLLLIFTILYITSFFLLGKAILNNNYNALFMLAFASPFMYSFLHYAFLPFLFALSFLPLALYCFHKKNLHKSWEFSLLLLILSFNIVFFHPFAGIMLLIVFIVFNIYDCWKYYTSCKNVLFYISNNVWILIVSLLAWYLSFKLILRSFGRVIDALFDSGESTIYESQMNTLESSNASILLIAERFLKVYGSISLYFLLAILCLIIVFRKKNTAKDVEIIYSLLFICAALFGIFQGISYFVVFEPIRISSFAIIVTTALLGIVFHNIYINTQNKKIIVICMTIVICLSSVVGVLNIYDSPWKGLPNKQITPMNSNGLDWFLRNANYSIPVMTKTSFKKYNIYKSSFDNSIHGKVTEINQIPTHFGYETNKTLSSTTGYVDIYMMTSEELRKYHLVVPNNRRSLIPTYTENDFKELNRDSTVCKIYLNGEFEVWKISRIN